VANQEEKKPENNLRKPQPLQDQQQNGSYKPLYITFICWSSTKIIWLLRFGSQEKERRLVLAQEAVRMGTED